MRENAVACDRFNFISLLEIKGRKAVNEHPTFYIKGHVPEGSDEYVLRNSASQIVKFTASHPVEGSKGLFSGIIHDISIRTENDNCILSLSVVGKSALMDIEPITRTFQDADMTYEEVTDRMVRGSESFNFLWPAHGEMNIGSMAVQYEETDWHFAKRLAGRLGTVVVPDYLLDEPYISIGMTKRPVQQGIDIISYKIHKGTAEYRCYDDGHDEREAISCIVKSRDIFDLCDGIPFLGKMLFVQAIDTVYEGNELVHYYTLKEKDCFFTNKQFNENIIGVSLTGTVRDVSRDKVQISVWGDVNQKKHKWFPFASPFTQPSGHGWYFMPEIGDEVRMQFPSKHEHDAFVSSGFHVAHGSRLDPRVKHVRTIYGQAIQFCPERILIHDNNGSSVIIDKSQGISMYTSKTIDIRAISDVVLSASGNMKLSGASGVSLQNGPSVVNIDDTIEISSLHNRVQ